ncbi:MAG: hypothetical protein HY047_05045 [Acidobacteria bacterium]|nr:hypothetical protein [Acidobacteriota bacterium]
MSWTTRAGTAAVLAVALSALPLVLDQCAASCEAHHDDVASTPSCHHASAATPRIGHVPAPCGHDHSGTVAAAAGHDAALLRAFHSVIAVLVTSVPPAGASLDRDTLTHAPPRSSLTLDARSLPLRI